MGQFLRVADFRQNMCAFLSRPHQANPHLFERRNPHRADGSSAAGVRASTFRRARKFPQQLHTKPFLTQFLNFNAPEMPTASLSNIVARSLGIQAFEFLRAESLLALSASDLPLQSTQISNFSQILGNVTPMDVVSFTFASTVFAIMAAYIVHELRDHGDSPPKELLDHNRQGIPRVENSPSTLRNADASETGDVWLNLSRSSPFFRSVCARCPSLTSSGAYQYVQTLKFKEPEFQRRCLSAPDGGTVALDWPSHLDIDGSKEMENIMLLVCGTTEGSHEDGIGKFSQLVEEHGYFPIVFNPRGCGGSPLTTPRVFSAADCDDVRLAVQFVAESRPWATILGVGWGLGANVLARYLGEEGSYTPLTAAVCIDNPFDLRSVTRPISGSRWVDYNHSMSKGLVQILDSSKMLFQGDKRGFDLSGAFAATSVRDFDEAISRIVHGYTTVEDFYVNTSSEATLEGVRIPLLSILHLEDYRRTQGSVLHQVFETNAYTMLLVASPSDSRDDLPGAASDWTHAIALEWLRAVEISMLKGRHPQLKEFSPTLKLPRDQSNSQNKFTGGSLETMEKEVATAVPRTLSDNSSHKEVAVKDTDMEMKSNRADMEMSSNGDPSHRQKVQSTGTISLPSKSSHEDGAKPSENSEGSEEGQGAESQLPSEGLTEAEEAERGQAVQVAETVMNVFDVTMPGTLADAQKQQVLKAVGRGETIVTALEEAVPEEVRGTMSTAVSEVVNAQGLSLKMAESQASAPVVPAGVTDSLQGKLLEWTGANSAPTSDVDISSGNKSSEDVGVSGKTSQNDSTTKEITPDRKEESSKRSLNDESMDSDKGAVAIKRDENSEPSKEERLLSKDLKDRPQQLESKSGGENKSLGDTLSTGSPNVDDQSHDQGDQGKNKQEQPGGSVDGPSEERKKIKESGGSSEFTSLSGNSADQIDGESRQGLSSASERKDTAKDMTSQVDSEDANAVAKKNSKMPKDAEKKGEVTAPTGNDGLQTPQSDPAKSPGANASSQPPELQKSQGDLTGSQRPDDRSSASGSQSSPTTDVPADTSHSDPGTDAQHIETSAAPPSSPPANSPPESSPPESSTPARSPPASSPPESSPPANFPPESSPPANSPPESSPPANPPPESSPPANSPPESSPPAPTPQDPPPQNPAVPLPSVGEAFQALTGFDDSTQMAVTNVFGVVESVLDQLEKDKPSADPESSSKVSAGKLLDDATAELTNKNEQNAVKPEDEVPNNEGNTDKQVEKVALRPNNQHNESSVQSVAPRSDDRNELKSMDSPREVHEMDPQNKFSRVSAGSRGDNHSLGKNWRGYISDAGGRRTEPGSDEVQDNLPNPQSTLLESNPNHVHDCPSQNEVDDGSLSESVNRKRLEDMAAEIEAECDDTVDSSSSGQVADENGGTAVQENESSMVADLVRNALKLEVLRRLGSTGLEALGVDLEKEVFNVAHAVSEAVTMGKNKLFGAASQELEGTQVSDSNSGAKLGKLNGNSIVTTLGSVLGSNSPLGQLLPFGVLAGAVMAALGATYLIVMDDQEEDALDKKRSGSQVEHDNSSSTSRRVGLASENYNGEPGESSDELGDDLAGSGRDSAEHLEDSMSSEEGEEWNEDDGVNGSASNGCNDTELKSTEETENSNLPHQGKIMGAVAAAMGATAAVASSASSTSEGQSGDFERNEGSERKLVPEFAEKAVSIVSPVIPKTEAGELDHERLVAVLTEVGQKGGPLTLVGKIALLWGGLRGAMSLSDRLLAFFQIKERPLHERLLGFGGMAVLLWTPVLVPLLPTLLQQWATKSPSGVADAAAIVGLYGAVFILVTIWGRRVRGYNRPLVSYGLQLFSRPKLRLFAGGVAIGLGMVSGYYGINWALGYSQFTWDAIVVTNPDFPVPLGSTILTSWKVLMLVTQSLAKAVAVALVEEVLFRSWLQEEIAVDLGYHWAVILSALAFAVAHWSPTAVAGLWFFAVALAGARARTNGDLSLAIGIHAGIVTAFSVMTFGGLVYFVPEAPAWITGAYAGSPWAGALGTGMIASLAVALYPRQEVESEEN